MNWTVPYVKSAKQTNGSNKHGWGDGLDALLARRGVTLHDPEVDKKLVWVPLVQPAKKETHLLEGLSYSALSHDHPGKAAVGVPRNNAEEFGIFNNDFLVPRQVLQKAGWGFADGVLPFYPIENFFSESLPEQIRWKLNRRMTVVGIEHPVKGLVELEPDKYYLTSPEEHVGKNLLLYGVPVGETNIGKNAVMHPRLSEVITFMQSRQRKRPITDEGIAQCVRQMPYGLGMDVFFHDSHLYMVRPCKDGFYDFLKLFSEPGETVYFHEESRTLTVPSAQRLAWIGKGGEMVKLLAKWLGVPRITIEAYNPAQQREYARRVA